MLGAIVISMLGFPQESLLLMAGKQRSFCGAISPNRLHRIAVHVRHLFVCWEQRLLTSVGNLRRGVSLIPT